MYNCFMQQPVFVVTARQDYLTTLRLRIGTYKVTKDVKYNLFLVGDMIRFNKNGTKKYISL